MSNMSDLNVLTARFRRLRIALLASLFLAIISFFFEVAELAGHFSLNTNPEVDLSLVESLYLILGFLLVVVGITTTVLWCMWLHRAAKNIVEAEIADFEYSPAWAVGWHFVPIANLFKPFEIMRKIWNASKGEVSGLDASAPIVNRWWTAWILYSIVGNISGRIALQAENPDTLYFGTALGAFASIASFVAIPTALKMLEAITQGQAGMFAEYGAP